MIAIDIPDFGTLTLEMMVSDYNGTLAVDGKLLPGVAAQIEWLATKVEIHVVTADTFGLAAKALEKLPVTLMILPRENQAQAKADYVREVGATRTVALGNGRNDQLMLKTAALGICLVQEEGAAVQTLMAADMVCRSAKEALDLFVHPKRLVATLRN